MTDTMRFKGRRHGYIYAQSNSSPISDRSHSVQPPDREGYRRRRTLSQLLFERLCTAVRGVLSMAQKWAYR